MSDTNDDYSESDDDANYYENDSFDIDDTSMDTDISPNAEQAEIAIYETLTKQEASSYINKSVEEISNKASFPVDKAVVLQLLMLNKFDSVKVLEGLTADLKKLYTIHDILPPNSANTSKCGSFELATKETLLPEEMCSCCCGLINEVASKKTYKPCGHKYCVSCWQSHFEAQINMGNFANIRCMETNCQVRILAPFIEEVVLERMKNNVLDDKFKDYLKNEYINVHPFLRPCPGAGCEMVIQSCDTQKQRVICKKCKTSFCFSCGIGYHAPATCEMIKNWMIKCADDSETANYISAHTKNCPKCFVVIQKSQGCNHMQCSMCKHHFCWMCLGDWKTHGSEFYECSKYKENPQIAMEANNVQARNALEKYLHYYERFENHSKSLKLEEELHKKINNKIDEKVKQHEGSWIDWEYLNDASALLTRCRYTLMYTYPYAYYLESGVSKDLFEYQQAQLEKSVEELSWKVERAEFSDRGMLTNHMTIAEKNRRTLAFVKTS